MELMNEQNVEPSPDIRTLQEENKRLKIDISSLQASNRSLLDQYKDERQRTMDLHLRLADCEVKLKNYEQLQTELEQSQNQRETISTKLHEAEQRIIDLEKQLDHASNLSQVKDELCEKQRKLLHDFEKEKKSLKERIEELEKTQSSLNNGPDEKMKALEVKCEEQESLIQSLNEKVTLLESLKEDAVYEVGLADSLKIDVDNRNEKVKVLEERLLELKSVLASKDAQLAQLKANHSQMTPERELAGGMKEEIFGPELPPELATKQASALLPQMKEESQSVDLFGPQVFPKRPPEPEPVEELPSKQQQQQEKLNLESAVDKSVIEAQQATINAYEDEIHDLKTLLNYREDLILKMYDEMSKKSDAFDQLKMEKEALTAQSSISKKELEKCREQLDQTKQELEDLRYDYRHRYPSSSRSRDAGSGGSASELTRYRRKYEEEREKRKRAEKEADEWEEKLNQMKAKLGRIPASSAVVTVPNPVSFGPHLATSSSRISNSTTSSVVHPSSIAGTSSPIGVAAVVAGVQKQASEVAERARILELQTTIRELRTENDAKRSELFDLRSRLDEKSSQIDQLTSQLKMKDKATTDMTNRLSAVQHNLDSSQRELRQALERVEASQQEMQQRQGDVLSMKTSNHYLVQCVHYLRRKLKALTGQEVSLKENGGDGEPQLTYSDVDGIQYTISDNGEPDPKRPRVEECAPSC